MYFPALVLFVSFGQLAVAIRPAVTTKRVHPRYTSQDSSASFDDSHRSLARSTMPQRIMGPCGPQPCPLPYTPNIPFKVTASSIGDVCDVGCEGDYSNLLKFHTNWNNPELEAYYQVQGRFAVLTGVVYRHFVQRTRRLLRDHPEVEVIVLVWVPGSADEEQNMQAAKMVHRSGLQVCIPSEGTISSGGTDFLLAGQKHYATPGADIGVHSWAYEDQYGRTIDARDVSRRSTDHLDYLLFFDAIDIPRQFYWNTVQYDDEDMHWIEEGEIATTYPYMRSCSKPSKIGFPTKYGQATSSFGIPTTYGQATTSSLGLPATYGQATSSSLGFPTTYGQATSSSLGGLATSSTASSLFPEYENKQGFTTRYSLVPVSSFASERFQPSFMGLPWAYQAQQYSPYSPWHLYLGMISKQSGAWPYRDSKRGSTSFGYSGF